MKVPCPNCKKRTVPVWHVLVVIGDGTFRCANCSYVSHPSARYSPKARSATIVFVMFVLPLLLLLGVLSLTGVLLGAIFAAAGYFGLVIYEYVHGGPPDKS